jgi:hypothetical protein
MGWLNEAEARLNNRALRTGGKRTQDALRKSTRCIV